MGTASAMLAEARRALGTRDRPNHITQDYARRHGPEFLRAPWCDMSVTYWARQSGNTKAVLPGGDRAYTVWHAQDFQKIGRWHAGTAANLKNAKPGDIVFFDWGGTDGIGYIDHVGIIEKVLSDGRVQTIEGNTGDACLRRVRSYTVIAGYGRPAYDPEPSGGSSASKWMEDMMRDLPMLGPGAKASEDMETLRALLNARSHHVAMVGPFDAEVTRAVKAVQKWGGVEADGVVGKQTWPVLLRIHK